MFRYDPYGAKCKDCKVKVNFDWIYCQSCAYKKGNFFFVFFLNLKNIFFSRNLFYVRNQNNGCEVLPSI